MKVEDARAEARGWLDENAPGLRGFAGAYLTGSTAWADPQEAFRPGSDVDLFVVIDGAELPPRPGKTFRGGVVLEINYVSWTSISDPAEILGNYHLAGAFVCDGLLHDPDGRLTRLRRQVSERFAEPQAIMRRCADARTRATSLVAQYRQSQELHERVTSLFFGAGVCAHMILVADQKNPTIRRRYAAAKRSLERMGRADFHERLIQGLGSADWTRDDADRLLPDVAASFDLACSVMRSPVWFASDMTPEARPIAIDGSAEMIEGGFYREAAFWLVAISARSRAVVAADGSAAQLAAVDARLMHLLARLGVPEDAAMDARARQIEADIEACWQLCAEHVQGG